tara:strand:- start:2537 stop:2740 length:204 start_codon:yes stop_codon:yes gene_type:complete
MKRRYRKSPSPSTMYVVINQDGEVFTGLRGGYPCYSSNWSEAKPLNKLNTSFLLREKGTELIKESEL